MKKLMVLALSGLLSTAAVRADVDIVAEAIKNSDVKTLTFLTVIGTTHNNSFAVSEDQKAAYVELAKSQLEKCQNESSLSFDAVLGLDIFSILSSVALTAGGAITIYEISSGQDEKRKLNNYAGKAAVLVGIGNGIKSLKDFFKHISEHRTESKKDLKKAKDVLKLVEAMPVKA